VAQQQVLTKVDQQALAAVVEVLQVVTPNKACRNRCFKHPQVAVDQK
jgi:hypothetical protein